MRQKLCNNLQYTLNLFYKGQSYFQLVVSPKFLDKLSSFVPYLSLIIYYVCLTTNPILDPFGHINWSEISKFMLKSLKIGQVNQSCHLNFWRTWLVSISVPYISSQSSRLYTWHRRTRWWRCSELPNQTKQKVSKIYEGFSKDSEDVN